MASIESQAENDFISWTFLQNIPPTQVYIGGVQFKEGGYTSQHWGWTDGSRFNFTNWSPGNYDAGGIEDCMTIVKADDMAFHGTWNDVPCRMSHPLFGGYICYTPLRP